MTSDSGTIKRLGEWLLNGDVGRSSLTIAAVMCGAEVGPTRDWCHPHDAQDFKRCVELLNLVPEWRDRIGEMTDVNPYWSVLAHHWVEVESVYRGSNGDALLATDRKIRELFATVNAP